MNEVNVRHETLPFINWGEKKRMESDLAIHPGDNQWKFVVNGLFVPTDMTDYEEQFTGWDEYPNQVPLSNVNWSQRWTNSNRPQTDALPNMKKMRESYHPGTGETMNAAMIDRYTDVDPPEYEVYGPEDDDEEEEDYDEEEEEEDYGEEAVDPFEAENEIREKLAKEGPQDTRFFRVNDKLRDKYSDSEIDQFMKILDIQPQKGWQDMTSHHYKLGLHHYEDENQEMDPAFHILSESEREEAEKIITKEWRKGTEVNFVLDGRVPIRPNYRF